MSLTVHFEVFVKHNDINKHVEVHWFAEKLFKQSSKHPVDIVTLELRVFY